MATLRIQTLYQAAWKVFGFQYDLAVADRDSLLAEIGESLGPTVASDIQCDCDAALQEIADRISANAMFVDPDDGFLPNLGLSWRQDVLPLIDGGTPGNMAVENVKKFLEMVRNTEGSAQTISDDVRKRRQELIAFLEKAVKLGEPIWCELQLLDHDRDPPATQRGH